MATKYGRLPSLTGLRFYAAALVFLCHFAQYGLFLGLFANHAFGRSFFFLVGRAGMNAVGFFFVLSGFVLVWSARPQDTAVSFWRRRVAKIYPNNTVAWLLGIAVLVWEGRRLSAGIVLPNLFLVQSWVPRTAVFSGVNPPSWSLACEALFYLSFPLLLRVVRRIPADLLWPAAVGLIAAVFLVPVLSGLLPGTPVDPDFQLPLLRLWAVYLFPLSRLLEFCLGVVLAHIVLSGRWPRVGLREAVAVAVPCYLLTLVVPVLFAMAATMLVPIVLIIGAAATADLAGTPSSLRGRRMQWLGEVSFAFYLLHELILMAVIRMIAGSGWNVFDGMWAGAAMFVFTLASASVLYAYVEKPALRRLAGRQRVRLSDRAVDGVRAA